MRRAISSGGSPCSGVAVPLGARRARTRQTTPDATDAARAAVASAVTVTRVGWTQPSLMVIPRAATLRLYWDDLTDDKGEPCQADPRVKTTAGRSPSSQPPSGPRQVNSG